LYNASTKIAYITVERNPTNELRPATIWVDATYPPPAESRKKTKLVSIKQEGIDDENSDWVLINGVKWATRNVGAPGSFVKNPEDYGEYYQWNKRTLDWTNNWNGNGSTTWLAINDPSPSGYRVPTLDELQSLVNPSFVSYEFTTRYGINVGRFTDKASGKSIFLPANGDKVLKDYIYAKGATGHYWSSTVKGTQYYLLFCSGGVTQYGISSVSGPGDGFGVRPVVK